MRESIAAKAVRYVGECRLTIEQVDAGGVRASCRGDGKVYAIAWNPDLGWSCSCPARRDCAHLRAVRLVTVRGSGS
jgi:hypothetical protein